MYKNIKGVLMKGLRWVGSRVILRMIVEIGTEIFLTWFFSA